MKLTDYKFWYIKRDDDGFIFEAAIRFFEGEITTKSERKSLDELPSLITRYRRTKKLQEADLVHLGKPFVTESSGAKAVLYTTNDFGVIKTDKELTKFLNKEIKKDTKRTPVEKQRE